jgi:hypothetical protein
MNPTSKLVPFFKLRLLKAVIVTVVLGAIQMSVFAVPPIIAVGPDSPHAPVVKRISVNGQNGNVTFAFEAYRNSFTGGVHVAAGDVNGDGVADIITGPGAGMGAQVNVFDGKTGRRMRTFLAFPGFFRGGVFVAAGDVNGDGKADIIVAPDSGAPPIVRVFDGPTGKSIRTFFAYSAFFTGGVRVAAGDVNGDGVADIITGAGPGGGPHVKVFDGVNGNLLDSFFAFDANFPGGVFVAAGDVNGDGKADLITGAGPGGGPHVKVFDGTQLNLLFSFFAYDASFTGGVRVAAGDVNGDGFADIVTGAGPGGGPHVKVFSGIQLDVLHSFFAYEANFTGGVFVGAIGSGQRVGGQ